MAATGYGYTPTGFYAKSLAVVEEEIDDGLKGILGESAGSNEDGTIPVDSAAGQLKTFLVDGFAAHWDLVEAVIASFDPNQATDAAQDVVCSITGTLRSSAQHSVATCIAVGDALTFLPVGRVISDETTGVRFVSPTGMTLAALSSWTASTSYLVGNLVTNNDQVFYATAAGVSTGSIGPSGTSTAITSAAGTWRYLGEGTAAARALWSSEETGPLGAVAYNLSEIESPIDGWNAVANPLDADAGRNQETNAALRVRRDAELATVGNTTVDAIRANVLKVNQGSIDPNHEQPTVCRVFYNDQDTTDANGLPPHSVEVLVQDGTDDDIAQAIWESVGGGTVTYGTSTGTAIDSEGNTQYVKFTRPTEVAIYVGGTARYDASEWSAAAESTVAQAALSALLTYTEDYPIGRDVRTSALNGAMMRGGYALTASGSAQIPAPEGSPAVPGLLEIDPLYIGISGASSTAQITISAREIAVFDSARCAISAASEEP
jgi:uncharacterized phage protein gp47/JayE